MADRRLRFTLEGRDNLSQALDRAGRSAGTLEKRLRMAALAGTAGAGPMAAAITAMAGAAVAGFASAGGAAAAFGVAIQPQIKLMTNNAAAAKKLADAQENMARKKQLADQLAAKGSDLAKKAQSAYTSSRLAAADAEKAYERQTKGMPKATADASLALAKLKTAHEKWSASLAKDTMPIFTKGLDGARKALPYLTPLVKTASHALSDFMDGLDGKGLKGFLDRINQAAKKTLPDLLNTGKNVFIGLGGIIDAFLPTSDKFTGGLEAGSEAFAKWGKGLGDSDGFKRFMDIAATGGGSLANLASAALNLYDALRPITGAWVDIAEGAAKFIRWLPPDALATIAGGLLAVKVAAMGIGAALALLNANPVTLAALAVIGLSAAFVTAWEKSQRFREIASQVMSGVAQVVLTQAKLILLGFQGLTQGALSAMVALVEGANGMFGKLPGVGHYFRDAAKAAEDLRTGTNKSFQDAIDKIDGYSEAAKRMPTDIKFKGEISDLDSKIKTAQARVDSLKQKRKTAVGADKAQLEIAVATAQARLDGLKQKKAATVRAQDQASGKLSFVQRLLSQLNGQVATTYVNTVRSESHASPRFHQWRGGPVRLAGGGMPGLIRGAGSATSDSIPAMLSNGEYVVRASAVSKYGTGLLDSINSGRYNGAGADAGRGLAAGLLGSLGVVQSAAAQMAAAVTLGVKGELQIASPSKKTRALATDVAKGFIEGLTGSRDKIKSTARDLANDIKTAFSGRRESSLLRMVDKQTKKLLDYAAQRDKIAAKIAEAKKYAADTTKTARDSAALSNLGMDADEVTAGGIKGGLQSKLARIQQFARYVSMLAKRGLNKGLIRQILDMGPEAGYAYASALAGADKATLASVNKTQSAIDKATTSLGRSGADILYDSGKNAGRGFLKGLEGQQKNIENLMLKIARSMQKAIKKALGIKSPSTVMAQLGSYSTQGLARGLVDAMPHLDRALDVVSGRVAATQPVLGRAAVAGGGGGTIYNVQVDVHEAMDPVAVGREVQRVLLQFGRAQGATVSLKVG
ncbi:hypothetical protein AB0I54_31660 [Streptomyces sp. NPDC050625]|uniref:hypothetical protein n=1 Tax=Streptomyces sp. NPDC050625 TaxID=3154629 RepID=UPI003444924D